MSYTIGKQTYQQLAKQNGCSTKTIQRYLDRVSIPLKKEFSSVANVLMDTTYFGRQKGLMLFKNSLTGEVLYHQFVKTETNKLYEQGIAVIRCRGIYIQSIICDGRKGLFTLFDDIPVQMCQFHQVKIITKYLTRKPQHTCGQELRNIALSLTKFGKIEFEQKLHDWYIQWQDYINERTFSDTAKRKSFYTHKRLRSAYFSLKRNIAWLFTCEDWKELMIPNTTNALDGYFSDLKNKLRNHNGLTWERKKKFIVAFISKS